MANKILVWEDGEVPTIQQFAVGLAEFRIRHAIRKLFDNLALAYMDQLETKTIEGDTEFCVGVDAIRTLSKDEIGELEDRVSKQGWCLVTKDYHRWFMHPRTAELTKTMSDEYSGAVAKMVDTKTKRTPSAICYQEEMVTP